MEKKVPATNSKAKILSFAAIGNALELYDYTLFGVLLPILSPKFFPAESYIVSMFFGYLAFALTFFISPIGSIFWGWYGDKFGRVLLLKNSMLLMAFPSIAIACLPTYDSIGVFAPIMLIILRLIQGISAGGEVIGSKIFAMEYLGSKYYGVSSGVISAAGAFGVLIAILVAYIISRYGGDNAWRYAFIFGSQLFIIAIFLRKNVAQYINPQANIRSVDFSMSVTKILVNHPYYSIIVYTLGAILGVMSYFMHVFVNPYLISLGHIHSNIYALSIMGLISTSIAAITLGLAIDKTEQSLFKWIYTSTLLFMLFTAFALNFNEHIFILAIGFIVMGASLGIFATTCAIMMFKCFPKEVRCRGIMINYAFGCSIFGGLTPIVLNALAVYSPLLIALIIINTLSILIFVLYRSLKNVSLY